MNRRYSRRTLWLGAILGTILAAVPALAADHAENFDRTYQVASNVRVSLANVNGSIEITAWDRNEVKISATKHAESQQKLAETKIDVQAGHDSVDIQTKLPQSSNHASVDYRIQVPRGARLQKIDAVNGALDVSGVRGDVNASLVNGKLTGRALTGNLELSTVNGKVDCELADLRNADQVKISTVNGALDISIPRDSNAHLTASTVHGGIHGDFNLPVKNGFVGASLDTTLGSGGAQVNLSSVNGPISIRNGAKEL